MGCNQHGAVRTMLLFHEMADAKAEEEGSSGEGAVIKSDIWYLWSVSET